MKEPKNIRIILVPVEQMERRDMEFYENSDFKTNAAVIRMLFHRHSITGKVGDFNPQVLTADEFRKMSVFTKVRSAFDIAMRFEVAMANSRKRKQCYDLSEFMDEFNNQVFGDGTDKYWLSYVKIR